MNDFFLRRRASYRGFARSEPASAKAFAVVWERRMKTYRNLVLATGALCLLAGQATAKEHPVLGQGNISCSSWLEGRQNDNAGATSRIAWVLGFMTAFNQYGSKSQADDVSEGKSTEDLMAWMDNYCRQHQDANLHRASAAFIEEFRERTGR